MPSSAAVLLSKSRTSLIVTLSNPLPQTTRHYELKKPIASTTHNIYHKQYAYLRGSSSIRISGFIRSAEQSSSRLQAKDKKLEVNHCISFMSYYGAELLTLSDLLRGYLFSCS